MGMKNSPMFQGSTSKTPQQIRRIIDIVAAAAVAILLLDRPIALFFSNVPETQRLLITVIVPDLGNAGMLLILAFITAVVYRLLVADRETAEKALFVIGSGSLAGLCADAMKGIFGRMRPTLLINDGSYGFDFLNFTAGFDSFPSSHAAVAAGLAGSLSILSPGNKAIIMNVAVMFVATRVIIVDHFLGDALFGFAVGLAATWCLHLLFERLGLRIRPPPPDSTLNDKQRR
jgi:membrane-associated phospholipid phosphatase